IRWPLCPPAQHINEKNLRLPLVLVYTCERCDGGMQVVYRILTIVVPQLRIILLRARARLAFQGKDPTRGRLFCLGDWFEFIDKLDKAIDGHQPSSAFA
ncbi:Innexin, partial [Caligus rogercresseyi]